MAHKVPIRLHVPNTLALLGSLYRHPADALEEYVSNALDECRRLAARGEGPGVCHVDYEIGRERIVVRTNTPGMGRRRFEEVLQRVADSLKRALEVRQIGRLGIGLWAFLQVGRRSVIRSRETGAEETLRVVLREGHEDAEFSRAPKHEALPEPGFVVSIESLRSSPLKTRGPLARERLASLIGEKFSVYLRDDSLRVRLLYPGEEPLVVAPPENPHPRVGEGLSPWAIGGSPARSLGLELHFDPTAKGKVAVRHAGVVVVESLAAVESYGLSETVYGSGLLSGALDADFLSPLPARTGFEEDEAWTAFAVALDRLRPTIEAEVGALRAQEVERRASSLHRQALEIARDILDRSDFRDLALPQGMGRRAPGAPHGAAREREPREAAPREPPREPGDRPGGPRFGLVERAFEDGPRRHSRLVGGEVQVNTLNADYRREFAGPEEAKVAYASLLVGKEVLAYNDASGVADDALERALSFVFALKQRTRGPAVPVGRRPRGRPRKDPPPA